MGLLELFAERFNPGPVGGFEPRKKPDPPQKTAVIIRTVISIIIIGLVGYLILNQSATIKNMLTFTIILLIYCLIGYFFIPKPDTSNMGWLGGVIDNPFRFSDDINRTLLFLSILLYPGRFIAETAVQIYRFVKGFIEGGSRHGL